MPKITVSVNPYKTVGSYYLIPEICKEVGCAYDPGSSMTPIDIFPEDEKQLGKVVELLDMFEMTYAVSNLHQILRDLEASQAKDARRVSLKI